MEKTEIILTDCIQKIKAGKATIDECLNRYPTLRKELEPLLRMALSIQKPENIELDSRYKQAAKARLLQQIKTEKPVKAHPFKEFFSFGIPARYAWARAAVSAIAIVLVLVILTGSTAYASQESLPGELLYPVKITTEDARLLMAEEGIEKTELGLDFAQRRLDEMDTLAFSNENNTVKAVNGYRNLLRSVQAQILAVSDTNEQYRLLNLVLADIRNQMVYCDGVIDAGPVYTAPVNEASTLTVRTQLELLKILEKQDALKAAQTNLNVMQNRLQRALKKAGESQFQIMQETLLQYRQFSERGDEILTTAQAGSGGISEIDKLSLNAATQDLDTIESIARIAPPEYQGTISNCREATIQFQTQARQRYQYRGGNGDNTPPMPENTDAPVEGANGHNGFRNQGENQSAVEDNTDVAPAGTTTPSVTPAPSPDNGWADNSGSDSDNGQEGGSNTETSPGNGGEGQGGNSQNQPELGGNK